MQGNARRKSMTLLAAGFAFCLFGALALVGCQSTPSGRALMPGIAAAEQISPQNWKWSPDQECAPCHSIEAHTAAASACTDFSDASSSCLTCHNVEQELTVAHENIRNVKPVSDLQQVTVEKEICTKCHTIASLAERTADSVALADNDGVTINPHALRRTKGHSEIDCTACHTMHESSDKLETSSKMCRECHHADSFECESCH